jgi:DNA helicase-2/ATP-dependent DNA helicase PcrA
LQEKYPNYTVRLEDVQQLAAFSRRFESVEEFLTQLALQTAVDSEEEQSGVQDDEEVRLSTIHQAKGLEFDVVFIIMLCDGLFPSSRSIENLESEEEERRLFYVAITRARDELHLSYPMFRAIGSGSETMQRPSRFLGELPKELLEEWNLRPGY